jgi:hypothetical protein
MAVPGDAEEHRPTVASQTFWQRHAGLAKLVRRSPLWVASPFIVLIGLIELVRRLGLARSLGAVIPLLRHGPVITIVCITVALAAGAVVICVLASLLSRNWRESKRLQTAERSQQAERAHELALVRLLAGAQFSTHQARLLEKSLARPRTLAYGPDRLETGVNGGDRTDKPAGHEDDRVMPDTPRKEDAPGSERPPSSGVV